MRRISVALILLSFVVAETALPCGLCREDNRAAVYSYRAMLKVRAHPNQLEFVVLKVAGAFPRKTIGQLTFWLAQQSGLDAGTLKISSLQKSIGFVWIKSAPKKQLVSQLSEKFPSLIFQILAYD